MVSSVLIQSPDFDDENFTPIFNRKRQEFYLTYTDKVKKDMAKVNVKIIQLNPRNEDRIAYLDKYFIGKRDHTAYREWTLHKFGVGYGLSYLLLRELPIRNFYARATIMIFFISKVLNTSGWIFGNEVTIAEDRWKDKDVRNYQIYHDTINRTIPTENNRLPERRVWELNQPGFLRPTPDRFFGTAMGAIFHNPRKT